MGSAVRGNRHVMLNDWEQQKEVFAGGRSCPMPDLRGVNSRLQVDRSRKNRQRGAAGVHTSALRG